MKLIFNDVLLNDSFNKKFSQQTKFNQVIETDSVLNIIHNPMFEGFGQFILPIENRIIDSELILADIGTLLPYHNNINSDTSVEVINYMISEIQAQKKIFYDFYSLKDKLKDPSKNSTGLFFFRGEKNAPFAIICPGGAFQYVGSIHEGFPYALELSKKGFNAFVLKYRVGSDLKAKEDLSHALTYIFDHSEAFNIDLKGYSLWGSSAGARMVASIGSNGTTLYGGKKIPKPSVIVMAYTGYENFSVRDPPTFVVVGENDRIAHVPNIEKRVDLMRKVGIEVEYNKYKNTDHGFGLGIDTEAQGWIEKAIRFWEKHILR